MSEGDVRKGKRQFETSPPKGERGIQEVERERTAYRRVGALVLPLAELFCERSFVEPSDVSTAMSESCVSGRLAWAPCLAREYAPDGPVMFPSCVPLPFSGLSSSLESSSLESSFWEPSRRPLGEMERSWIRGFMDCDKPLDSRNLFACAARF